MLRDAWQIGRLFGIPLRVHISWLIIFGLISWSLASGYFPAVLPDLPVWSYWVQAVVAAVMLFASIILHELGHSLVARHHGVGISSITLFVFGGVSQMKEEPREPRQEFQIAIVGPLISLALAGGFWVVSALWQQAEGTTAVTVVLFYLAWINLLVAIFNMLPVFLLDGGRVLRAGLWHFRQSLASATQTAASVGRFFAFMLVALGVLQLFAGNFGGLWLMLIGWFIMQAGTAGARQASLREALGGLRVADVMVTDPVTVQADASVDELIDAYVTRYTYGGYPVQRNGKVVGLVTLHDLQKIPRPERADRSVEDIMTPLGPALLVDPDTPVFEAFTRMVSANTGRLLVQERGRVVGLITLNGVMHLAQIRTSLDQ
jgi:Zn-dependent protease/predicted transcriptional regulator